MEDRFGDIANMSGHEFESLCAELLSRMGFGVRTTKQSRDGGVDVVLTNESPILGGTYIVQCKRFSGSVGEPVVRDLYGVVTAERANKGILITTGRFTQDAAAFATGKNIELIDGAGLLALLSQYGLSVDAAESTGDRRFLEMPSFDAERYKFFRSLVDEGSIGERLARDFVLGFMFDYLAPSDGRPVDFELVHAGLAKEYVRLYGWYCDSFLKRVREPQRRRLDRRYLGIALLYQFRLFDYVKRRYGDLEELKPLKLRVSAPGGYGGDNYSLDDAPEIYRNAAIQCLSSLPEGGAEIVCQLQDIECGLFGPDGEKAAEMEIYGQDGRLGTFHEAMNALSVFYNAGVGEGVELVRRRLFGCSDLPSGWAKNIAPFSVYKSGFFIMYPSLVTSVDDAGKLLEVCARYDNCIDISGYYSAFASLHKDSIVADIQKIKALLPAKQ